jgi:hypothetical protein
MLLGDFGGSNMQAYDCIYVNSGQVGFGHASGNDCEFNGCIAISELPSEYSELDCESGCGAPPGCFKPREGPASKCHNVGAYVVDFYPELGGCSGHKMIDCRTWFSNGDGFYNAGNCGAVDETGSIWQDGSLDIEDYRVTL